MLFTKNVAFVFTGIVITTFCSYSSEVTSYLDSAQRPQYVTEAINEAFDNISCNRTSNWLYNGSAGYGLANLKDKKLIEKIIASKPEKKDFYFLDVGAGNFSWGHHLAQHIETLHKKKRIAQDVHVHIISVRGEQNHINKNEYGDGRLTWIKTDSYTLYDIGYFKIEELENELNQYDIVQKFDLIVSSWTFRHLVNPTDTLRQIFNRLDENGGLFSGDGFFIDYPHSKFDEKCNADKNMTLLLVNSKIPFLIHPYSCNRSMNQFIIQRTTDTPLQIPLLYHRMRSIGSNYQCASEKVICFQETMAWEKDLNNAITYKYTLYDKAKNKYKKHRYYGPSLSQPLFDWLIEHKLIYSCEAHN
ncbi:MAG TPA: hypothetical protein VL201_01070 [Patescibacteria group bacterium]|jgi:hypothetical protein|nr:hypothetical protein [Patescibacteria group bacterium]